MAPKQDADFKRRHKFATAIEMRRRVASRRCPVCGRGGALVRTEMAGIVVDVCRWCGFERGRRWW